MEGTSVLLTDFKEDLCYGLLDFLISEKAVPFILIKDFEVLYEVYETFPGAIPVVLDCDQCLQSCITHLAVLPEMSCVFNFTGDSLENLYRLGVPHFSKSITISEERTIDEQTLRNEIVEAVTTGYTLIVNATPKPEPLGSDNGQPLDTGLLSSHCPTVEFQNATSSSSSGNEVNIPRNLKYVFEKVFLRQPHVFGAEEKALKRKKINLRRGNTHKRESSSFIGNILRKLFVNFNPCSAISVINFLPKRAVSTPIKTPEEIEKYIQCEENKEIETALRTIHESALKNWEVIYEANFQTTPLEYATRFSAMVEEIKEKSEEGRKILIDKVNKDMEGTKHYFHVLGDAKTIDRLRYTREKEVEMKVAHFCKRKISEARHAINKEIEEKKARTKARFYAEILDEQMVELMRIKTKYEKQKELLMLPYSGELRLMT